MRPSGSVSAEGLPSVIMMICRMSLRCDNNMRRDSFRPSAVFVRLAHRFRLDAGGEVLRLVGAEAGFADAAEQVLQRTVAEEVDALFGEVELHLLSGFLGHPARTEQRLLPRR